MVMASDGTANGARVLEAAKALRAELAAFEPGLLRGVDCAHVADELSVTEKACAAARLVAGARAVEDGAHKEAGFADPVAWMARQGGTTSSQARQALQLARSLDAHPETKDALLSGAVSVLQAQEITKAQSELEGSEHDLLELARQGDLTRVRDEVRERRLNGTPVDDLHRRQVAARRFRHWRDGLGMICFEGALPPETGIPFVNRIERRAARLHRDAKRRGVDERFEANAADALVELSIPDGSFPKGATDLVIVCDLYAWRRGHAHENEPCHLIGGGPIPVGLAKELAEDAFVKVVLHDGKDVQRVLHPGRKLTAHLRTALDVGPVPAFSGRECIDCTRRYGLEYDHDDPVANQGPTSYANMKSRCHSCHAEKTERDRRAGLLGGRTARRAKLPGRTRVPGRAKLPGQTRVPGWAGGVRSTKTAKATKGAGPTASRDCEVDPP